MNRKDQMIQMRRNGATLQEIGDAYGISRERVRQIIGDVKVNRMDIRAGIVRKFAEMEPDLNVTEIARYTGTNEAFVRRVLGNARMPVTEGDTAPYKGYEVECRVSKMLTDLGIENTLMPYNHPFDMLLADGRKVEVKSSYAPMHPPSQHSPFYSFHVRKDKKGDYADFFLFVVASDNNIYVVPNADLPAKADTIRIQALEDDKRQRIHATKYDKYLNNFELMKG